MPIPAQQCRNVSRADRFACAANDVGFKACEEKGCCFDYKAGSWDVACYYPIGKILINFINTITTINQQSWNGSNWGLFTITA